MPSWRSTPERSWIAVWGYEIKSSEIRARTGTLASGEIVFKSWAPSASDGQRFCQVSRRLNLGENHKSPVAGTNISIRGRTE